MDAAQAAARWACQVEGRSEPCNAGAGGAGAGRSRRGFPDQGVAHCDSFVRFALILGDLGECLQAGR